jgi:hypothetical protein
LGPWGPSVTRTAWASVSIPRSILSRPNLKDVAMTTFDYGTEAELFPTKARKQKGRSFCYKRFERAAEAIRFAIEELPPARLVGTYLEVDEERYNDHAIRQLYESVDYPLTRRSPELSQ